MTPLPQAMSKKTDRPPTQPTLFDHLAVDDPSARGYDDMNLVEIVVGLQSTRRYKTGSVVTSPWERGDRSYFVSTSASLTRLEWDGTTPDGNGKQTKEQFYIEIEGSTEYGLPDTTAEDILVALMKLCGEGGFESPKVLTTRYELMRLMRWPTSSYYYHKLEKILNQLVGMTIRTNALWDPDRGRYFTSAFNLIDSFEIERTDAEHDAETYVTWGSKAFSLFQAGYIKHLNTRFYYSLNDPGTKRLYRWLDKHLKLRPYVEVDVLRLAHKQLGYGVSYQYPSKIIQKLRPKLDDLQSRGFCRWRVDPSKTDSGQKFVFTRVTTYTSVPYPRRDYVVEALVERGVESAEDLVERHGWDECLQQIEHHDYLEQIHKPPRDSGAWLRKAIEKGYKLPPATQALIDRARHESALWCEEMYRALTEEERAHLHRATIADMDQNDVQKYQDGHQAAGKTYLRLRNRKLVSRDFAPIP